MSQSEPDELTRECCDMAGGNLGSVAALAHSINHISSISFSPLHDYMQQRVFLENLRKIDLLHTRIYVIYTFVHNENTKEFVDTVFNKQLTKSIVQFYREKPAEILICWGCGTNKQQLRCCSSCNVVRYCGKDCQRQDGKTHKKLCTMLKNS